VRVTSRRFRRGLGAAIFGVACVAGLPRAAAAQQGLTVDEVVEMRKKGVSTRQVLRYVQEYCLAFSMNDSIGRLVKDAGGDAELVAGLKTTCTIEAPIVHIAPGTLLDADMTANSGVGEFSSPDGLCTAHFEKGGLRFTNKRRTGGCVIGYPTDPLDGPVRLTLAIADLGTQRSSSVALGFGRVGNDWNHYAFSIGADQHAELCLTIRETCRRLVTQSRVASIQTGPGAKNRLDVEIRNRQISLSINGQPLAIYDAPAAVTGTLVLGVGPLTSVVFEKLSAQSLVGDRATARLPQ